MRELREGSFCRWPGFGKKFLALSRFSSRSFDAAIQAAERKYRGEKEIFAGVTDASCCWSAGNNRRSTLKVLAYSGNPMLHRDCAQLVLFPLETDLADIETEL